MADWPTSLAVFNMKNNFQYRRFMIFTICFTNESIAFIVSKGRLKLKKEIYIFWDSNQVFKDHFKCDDARLLMSVLS